MATKTAKYKGGAIKNTDEESFGFACDDESNLHFVADTDTDMEEGQLAYTINQHHVLETLNPIWNNVNYKIIPDITVSESGMIGHVTLQGVTNEGIINDIMQHQYKTTTSTEEIKTFDLLQSACTGGITKQEKGSSVPGAGNVAVDIPKRYENYESVTLCPSWYHEDWDYRMAAQIEQSLGLLHGKQGHMEDYYGFQTLITYNAHMNSDFSDLRFTGNDGVTECPYYILDKTDSTSAAVIVMIPWAFIDKEGESLNKLTSTSGTQYTHNNPTYLYCYYGNSSATAGSDVTLGGQSIFYDEFDVAGTPDTTKWATTEPAGTNVEVKSDGGTGSILELQVDASTSATAQINSVYTWPIAGTSKDDYKSYEIIFKINRHDPLTGTISQGFYIQLTGISETNSWYQLALRRSATGAKGGGDEWYWRVGVSDSGSASYQSFYESGTDTTKIRYIKFRRFKRNANYGNDNVVWYASYNGVDWDIIGQTKYTGSAFDAEDDMQLKLAFAGSSSYASSQYVWIDKVISYPVATNEHEVWSDSFQNGDQMGRYEHVNYASGTRYSDEASVAGEITLRNTLGTYARLDTTNKEALLMFTDERQTQGKPQYETVIYEVTISDLLEQTGSSSAITEGGIWIGNGSALATSQQAFYGVRYVHSGTLRQVTHKFNNAGTVGSPSIDRTYTDKATDFPMKLRITLDHKNKQVYLDSKFKSDTYWKRVGSSSTMYNTYINDTSVPYYMGLYYNNATTNSGYVTFTDYKCYSGMNLDDTWRTEETNTPISPSGTPDDDTMTLTFDSTTIINRGACYVIKTQPYGGAPSVSKTFYLDTLDYINIGPDGMDKYIGMRLEFDFSFADGDSFRVDEINYVYEVI